MLHIRDYLPALASSVGGVVRCSFTVGAQSAHAAKGTGAGVDVGGGHTVSRRGSGTNSHRDTSSLSVVVVGVAGLVVGCVAEEKTRWCKDLMPSKANLLKYGWKNPAKLH